MERNDCMPLEPVNPMALLATRTEEGGSRSALADTYAVSAKEGDERHAHTWTQMRRTRRTSCRATRYGEHDGIGFRPIGASRVNITPARRRRDVKEGV